MTRLVDTTATPPAQRRNSLGLCAFAAALPAIMFGLRNLPDLLAGGLVNPDSAMRLVRLHDILEAGRPLHAVLRDASGTGAIMSWSHCMDSLLLLLAAPLAALLGWTAALHAAGLAWGPLCMAGLGAAIAWAATPALPPAARRTWLWAGAFAAGCAPAVLAYGMPGVVHHHIPLAITAVMAAGWALRLLLSDNPAHTGNGGGNGGGTASGIALGAWTAAGLWLSPEALPFALMAHGALWAAWLHRRERAYTAALLAAALAFALLTTLAWWVDPPAAGAWAVEPDRLSIPYVLLALGATGTAAAAHAGWGRAATIGIAGALAGAWLTAFPQALHGTAGLMTADQAAAFFGPITEMKPVAGLSDALIALAGGVFALLALLTFAAHRPPALGPTHRPGLLYAAACTAAMLALASTHIRFATYPSLAGAALLPIVLAAISASAIPAALQAAARVTCLAGLVASPILAPLAASASPVAPVKPQAAECRIAGAIALVRPHPGAIVLADVDDTPALLYGSQVRTVGSLYHRNIEGYMRLRAAWRSIPAPDAPTPELRATGATLLLACPGAARSALLEGLPPTTLMDRLGANDPPAWLHPIANAGLGGYVLYQLVTP